MLIGVCDFVMPQAQQFFNIIAMHSKYTLP